MEIMEHTITIPKEHTDHYNHVNYSFYLLYFQEGHRLLLKNYLGVDYKGLEKYGVRALARHIEIDYLGELFEGDKITVYTIIERLGNTSMTFSQEIKKDDKIVSKAKMVSVYTDLNSKPIKIPEEIRNKLN